MQNSKTGFGLQTHIPILAINRYRLAVMLTLASILALSVDASMAGTIDDFEDGVIDTNVWAIGEGNYAGGVGVGTVSESNGQLILDSYDGERHGAGVASAVLKNAYLGVKVLFSFDLSIEDTSFADPSYIPRISFEVSSRNTSDYVTGVWPPKEVVYEIKHDQIATSFALSGTYYFLIDPLTQEARLYDNSDDSLLGAASYTHFVGEPYIAFNAYTDVDQGAAHTVFKLYEISEIPEPASLVLLVIGSVALVRRNIA